MPVVLVLVTGIWLTVVWVPGNASKGLGLGVGCGTIDVSWLTNRVRSALSLSYWVPKVRTGSSGPVARFAVNFRSFIAVATVPFELGRSRSTNTAPTGVPATGK